MTPPPPGLDTMMRRLDDVPADRRPDADDTGLTLLLGGVPTSWQGPSQRLRSAPWLLGPDGVLGPIDLGGAALASAAEGRAAVEAAARAWAGGGGPWPTAPVSERIEAAEEFARRARRVREPVARALMWEVGKPWADSLAEFDRTLDYLDATLDVLRETQGRTSARALGSTLARVQRAPLGVTLCLGPYNYAVNEVFTLVLPALLAGNPVIIKTPRYGIRANALLVPALAESFPPGAVQLVTGDGPTVVAPMMESGLVDVLALIGSHRTAGVLLRQHPRPHRLRSVLGMGAKNPAIVLADADLDASAREIVAGALTFNGQRCTALKHVLVERAVADGLVERMAEAIDALRIGMPWQDGVEVTPLPDPERPAYLEGLVRDAVAKGARVVNAGGGERLGTLFRPALVHPVPSEALLFRVEQFGPVVPVSVVDGPDDALRIVAESEMGQQASVFGSDPAALARMVDGLANLVCRVNLNTQCRRGPDALPFTGRKDSAYGTLSVPDALETFSIPLVVAGPADRREELATVARRSRVLADFC